MATILPQPIPTDEVLDVLLSGPSAEDIIRLRPSAATQERLRALLDGSRNATLSDAERAELDAYPQREHVVRHLKIRAHERLAAGAV